MSKANRPHEVKLTDEAVSKLHNRYANLEVSEGYFQGDYNLIISIPFLDKESANLLFRDILDKCR